MIGGIKEKDFIMNVTEDIKKKIVDEAVDMREQEAIYCDMMNRIKTEERITPVIQFAY